MLRKSISELNLNELEQISGGEGECPECSCPDPTPCPECPPVVKCAECAPCPQTECPTCPELPATSSCGWACKTWTTWKVLTSVWGVATITLLATGRLARKQKTS